MPGTIRGLERPSSALRADDGRRDDEPAQRIRKSAKGAKENAKDAKFSCSEPDVARFNLRSSQLAGPLYGAAT